MKKRTRLILALDVTESGEAKVIAESVSTQVDAIKVNYPLVLSSGLKIVKDLSPFSDIICDFKVADVPHVNRLIVRRAFDAGARGIIVQGFVGEDSVRACVEEADGDVFVVTEMSHPGGQTFTAAHAEEVARIAVAAGASGIVAPATRPERIAKLREIVGNLLILSPGIGAQGGNVAGAIKAGADYVIAGRAIYEAKDRAEAAKKISSQIKLALQGR